MKIFFDFLFVGKNFRFFLDVGILLLKMREEVIYWLFLDCLLLG